MALGKYRFIARGGYPVTFGSRDVSVNPDMNPALSEHVMLPEIRTPDILTFSGKYVESGANLNRAYFDIGELIEAYPTISYKAVDMEHELEKIVGHIWSHAYVDRKTNIRLDLDVLRKMTPEELANLQVDVIVGGITYIDRFPELENPIKRKAYGLSMECYMSSFDLLLENGVMVTVDEAQALGLDQFIESIMGEFKTEESFNKAHMLKVILADKREVPMKVYKYLRGITFSGAGYTVSPACPSCNLITTSIDDCNCDEGDKGADEASLHTQADTLLTINLTELDSYMKTWRESKDGKPLNHQVVTVVDNDPKKEVEASENNPSSVAEPDGKTRDPLATDKGPARCPQYKYELWTQKGEGENVIEEQQRHWCIYANDKCPTAGDRTWHECLRWYKRESDWIQDMRNFRDSNNPFAPEGYDTEGEDSIMMSSSIEFKRMDAMVDSFLYKVESVQREREIKEKRQTEKSNTKKLGNHKPNLKIEGE